MEYNKEITGRVIGRLRTQRAMSQEVLAGLAGITRSHLSLVETGRKSAGIESLWRIAEAFDMRLSELIYLVEDAHERAKNNRRE